MTKRSLQPRLAIYVWLSKLYLGSDFPKLFDPALLDEMATALPSARDVVDRLKKYSEGSLDAVREEYDQLFVVPVKGRYVPPYESCFRERPSPYRFGDVWSTSTQAVVEFYRAAGYEPDLLPNTAAPDHLGLELAFMAKLCSDEIAAGDGDEADRCARMRREFLKTHLLKWVGDYASALRGSPLKGLYADVASITELFLQQELGESHPA